VTFFCSSAYFLSNCFLVIYVIDLIFIFWLTNFLFCILLFDDLFSGDLFSGDYFSGDLFSDDLFSVDQFPIELFSGGFIFW